MKKLYTLVILFSLFAANKIFAQTNSYLGLDGGFEGSATIDNAGNFAAPQTGKWSKANNNITIAGETGTVRSGSNSIKVSSSTSSTARMYSPQFTVGASTTKWQIQVYRRAISTSNTVQFQLGNYRGGTEALSGTYAGVTAANTWEKLTYSPTSTTSATTVAADIIAKMLGTGGDVFLDDFAIYESATIDVTAANAPTAPGTANPTGSSLDVSWTAASGGVDGGGYMVVRGLSDPTTTPNANGIYAVGNTTAAGETVVYVGTGTSFTDNSGMSASTTYYYRIYTFDKAYNYSSAATTNGTTSGVCLAPTAPATSITFASTTVNSTTVNWSNGNGSKRIVVARLGSAVTWTPSDNNTYAANASFGSGTDVSGSGEYVVYNGSAATVPVTNLAATSTYYFKVYEYNCTAGSEKYYLTSPPSNSVLTPASIAAPTFTSPVCISAPGATLLVSFTSTGTFSGNTYNVELSSSAGSFASPTVIGTTVSNANTITNLSCTIPYGTAGGTGYFVRVTASGPATTSATTALTINTISISPLTTQNLSPGATGTTLTAAGYSGGATRQWAYGTVSGGPYGTNVGGGGTTYTPTFALCGTYYQVCTVTNYSCGTTYSAEVQCNVTLPAVTGVTYSNACINDATLSWTLPGGFNGTNNSILVFAKASSAVTVGTPTNAASSYTASTTFGSGTPYQNDASAYCVYNGTSNTVNITGLTPGITYNFLVQNVQNSPTVYATAATQTGATLSAPSNVTGLAAVTANGEVTLNWTNPTACWDEIMVVATDGGSVTATPTGNGSLYFDNSFYGDVASNVNLPSNEFDVYQSTGTSIIVSSLLNGQAYAFKVFVRKGTVWSTGATISATPTTVAGDYQSTGTGGNWDSPSTWLIYNGSSWVAASTFPNRKDSCQVTIVSGTTVTVNTSNRTCAKLIVNSGGKLYANLVPTSSNLKYLNVFGNIQDDGIIGNGSTDDALGFNIEGSTCTISGTGTFHANRIRKSDNINAITALTIAMDMLLTWNGTDLYNNQASTIFNVTINAGKTVSTSTNYGNVSVDGTSGNGSGNMRGTITVKGTLNINGILYMTTDNGAGSPIAMTITGTGIVNVDSIDASASSAGGFNLSVQNGGLLNVKGVNGFFNFSTTNNTFSCVNGSTVEYSASGNQTVRSEIAYGNLKYSGSGDKTTNGNLSVGTNLTVDAAVFNAASTVKTLTIVGNLTLQNGGTFNVNCKSFLDIATSLDYNQTFNGNNQIIYCRNFSSVKTVGIFNLTGASGVTDLYATNDFSINYSGVNTVFNDNGNTISVGDDAEIGGGSSTSSNFNFTGTLKFICIGASTDIHLSDYAGTGMTIASINNLTIDALSSSPIVQVQIFPTGGTGTLTVKGNVAIQNTNSMSDLLNPNNNTISVKGSWSDYSASGFSEGSGQVILSGTSAQTISTAETFYTLEINNSNGVSISSNTIVSNQLKLTNGKLTTGSNEIQVTSNSTGSVTGYSSSSWVYGNLRRTVASTGTYDFPVGDASNFQLASLKLNSSTGISTVLGFFTSGLPATLPVSSTCRINGSGIYSMLNGGFWTITPNSVTAANYDITLNERGYSNFSGNATQLGIIKRHDNTFAWSGAGGATSASEGVHSNTTQSISSGIATAVRTSVTTFSDYGVGIGSEPLPVTLSSFTLVVKENNDVELNWRTEAEINCDYYSVERSEDGISFNPIGKVSGHGTSDQPHSYQLTDYNPFCAQSYYRLKQSDFSGEENLSNILFANIACNGISIAPNLVLDNLNLKFLSPVTSPLKITITNIDGRVVLENKIVLNENNFTLNVSSLAAGLYFIQLTNGVNIYNNRFVKQ